MTYDDITLEQWYEMQRESEEQPSDFMRGIAQQAVLEGIDIEDILAMPIAQSSKLGKKYEFLQDPIIGRMPKTWNGYAFITDFKDMATGDFADLMTIAQDPEVKYKSHQMIAKLWLSDLQFEDASDLILKNMNAVYATGISSFFLQYCEDFEIAFQQYSRKKMRKAMKEMSKAMTDS